MKKCFLLFFSLVTIFAFSASDYKYWVQFTDKKNSDYSICSPSNFLSSKALERRKKCNIAIDSTDLPVSKVYVDSLQSMGAIVLSKSKWLNGITIATNETDLVAQIASLSFVKKVENTFIPNYARKAKSSSTTFPSKRVRNANEGYGNAFNQINMHNGTWLHQAGYKGDGMLIAVLDAGFLNVNNVPAFAHAFSNGQIVGTKDFVDAQSDVYSQHYHGEQVLSVMAGYDYNRFIGTAPNASYWLIRTEDSNTEFPIEIDNMVVAMEFADSVGADIITASLGYNSFDDPLMSFTYANLDGKTCRASIAENLALCKGMIVVNSVGNVGALPWHYITVPADAEGILSVGAVTENIERSSFSSFGPTADGRIKPAVVALGSNTAVINSDGEVSENSGTSLSCPIIAGLTACLWQALPDLSNIEIIDLIKKNGHQTETPNNEIGYGVPDFYAAYLHAASIYKNDFLQRKDVKIYPNPIADVVHVEIKSTVFTPNLSLVLVSTNGKEVLNEKLLEASSIISLKHVKGGVYNLFIKTTENVLYRDKLIIK